MSDKTYHAVNGRLERMSERVQITQSRCPDCGHDAALLRVRGNAFSSVCESCRRVDVAPLLTADDLLLVEGERFEARVIDLRLVRARRELDASQQRALDLAALVGASLTLRLT